MWFVRENTRNGGRNNGEDGKEGMVCQSGIVGERLLVVEEA